MIAVTLILGTFSGLDKLEAIPLDGRQFELQLDQSSYHGRQSMVKSQVISGH